MENEQATQATIQEPSEESTTTEKTVDKDEQKPVEKTYTEEEFKKAQQSAASKAKFEILKELNIENVAEFKNKENDIEKIRANVETLQNENTRLKQTIKLKELGIRDDLQTEFLNALGAIDSEHFEEKAKELISKTGEAFINPVKVVKDVKIGTGFNNKETSRNNPILEKYGIKKL